MLLSLASTASYAHTSESQASLGTATTLAAQIPISGADLLGIGSGGGAFVIVRGTGTSSAGMRFQMIGAQVNTDLYLGVIPAGGQTNATYAIIPRASISSGTDYVLYADAGPGGRLVELYTAAGTLVGSGNAAGVTVANNGAANGRVEIGAGSLLTAVVADYDAIAIYGARLSGADRYTPTDVEHASLLWAVLDDSGQVVSGGTELDILSGATWEPGGTWNPPAPTYEGAIEGTATAASGAFSGAYAAPAALGVLGGQAQPATGTFSGAYSGPIVGTLGGQAGAASGGFTGTHVHDATWGILGDSNSDEYADDNRGAGTPYEDVILNWTELVAAPQTGQPRVPEHDRGLYLGSWGARSEPRRDGFAYNWARSGAVAQDVVDDQLAGLVAQIIAGDVTHVAIQTPMNDWHAINTSVPANIYNSPDGGITFAGGGSIAAFVTAYVNRMITCIDDVVDAGAIGVVVMSVSDPMAYPPLHTTYPNATRRGYVTAAIDSVRNQLASHAASVNSTEGRHVVEVVAWDEGINPEIFATYDAGTDTVQMLGLTVGAGVAADSNPLYLLQHAAAPHQSTLLNGVTANAFIAAANTLPGIEIQPYSNAEIRENAGLVDEATGVLGGTAEAAAGSFTGVYAAPVYAGTLSGTAADASASFSGTYAAPTYAGSLSGTAGAAAGDFTGTYAAPEYAGALGGQAAVASGAFSGAYAVPAYTGAIGGTAAAAASTFAATYSAPAGVMGGQAGAATGGFTGAYDAPVTTGELGGVASPASGTFEGAYIAPVGGVLAGTASAAAGAFDGSYAAPEYDGVLAGVAADADGAFGGSYFEPGVIVASLRGTAGTAYGVFAGSYEAPTGGGYFSSATFRVRPALTATIR